MTDGITWLAAPQSITCGGYSVLLARGLGEEELVSRLAGAVCGERRVLRSLGELTGADLLGELEDEYGEFHEEAAVRVGRDGEWVFAVLYGLWQGEFEITAPGVYKNLARGIVALVFRCRPVGGGERISDEAVAVEWLTPAEVRERMAEVYAVRLPDAVEGAGPHVRAHDGRRFVS